MAFLFRRQRKGVREQTEADHRFQLFGGRRHLAGSRLGDDVMHNLITLCVSCHGKCHGARK